MKGYISIQKSVVPNIIPAIVIITGARNTIISSISIQNFLINSRLISSLFSFSFNNRIAVLSPY